MFVFELKLLFLEINSKDYKVGRLYVKAEMGNWGTEWGECGE